MVGVNKQQIIMNLLSRGFNKPRLTYVTSKLSNIKDGTAELLLRGFCGFYFKGDGYERD